MGISEALALLATVFLIVHLLTDARRMVQVLRREHKHRQSYSKPPAFPCPRCAEWNAGLKEAWWKVATLVALAGHLAFDYFG